MFVGHVGLVGVPHLGLWVDDTCARMVGTLYKYSSRYKCALHADVVYVCMYECMVRAS
jgi:hypothetical protein